MRSLTSMKMVGIDHIRKFRNLQKRVRLEEKLMLFGATHGKKVATAHPEATFLRVK